MYDIPSVLDQQTLPALQIRCKRNRTPQGVRVQDCTVFTSLLDKHMDTEALHAPLGHWRLFPMSNLLTCVHDSQIQSETHYPFCPYAAQPHAAKPRLKSLCKASHWRPRRRQRRASSRAATAPGANPPRWRAPALDLYVGAPQPYTSTSAATSLSTVRDMRSRQSMGSISRSVSMMRMSGLSLVDQPARGAARDAPPRYPLAGRRALRHCRMPCLRLKQLATGHADTGMLQTT